MTDSTFDILDTFPNPKIKRDFTINIEIPEFQYNVKSDSYYLE